MGSHYNGISLGSLYIAAVLRNAGHKVGVHNADHEDRNDYLDQAGLFKGFDGYKKIHEDANHPIWNETVDKIIGFNPDFLGISMYTANYRASVIIAEKVKKINPDIKIIVGGVHTTLAPAETLTENAFDYAVIGEGELTMKRLVGGDDPATIYNLGFKPNGKAIQINPVWGSPINLDSLPLPARDLMTTPPDNTDFGMLITGRGCPYSCSYCAAPTVWGKHVRLRSVDSIMEELKLIKEQYPHNVIYFEDDTFTMNARRTMEICRRIIKERLDIKWKCDTRADCVSDELLTVMKRAGCVNVKIGVESGSERILESVEKRVSKDKIRAATQMIKRHGIPLTAYLMTGFPGETDDDLRQTIQFAREIDADYYSLSILAPYFGTKIYNDWVAANGAPAKKHWEYFYHQSGEMFMNDQLSSDLVAEFLALNDKPTMRTQ